QTFEAEPFSAPRLGILLNDALDDLTLLSTVHPNPRQSNFTDSKVHQPPAEFAHDVVVLFGNADLENLQLTFVQPDSVVKFARTWVFRFRVREKDLGGAVFQNDIRDR